ADGDLDERDLALHAELVPLLEEGGQVAGRQAADHDVRLGLADLQDEGAEVGGVERHFVDAHFRAAGLLQELARALEDVLAERVGGGDVVPLLAVLQGIGRQHALLHRDRRVEAEGVAVAVLAGDVGRRGVVADERYLELGRLGFLAERVGGQRAAQYGAHLVLLHQLLHVLHGALRARLVEPHQLGRLAHHHLVALLQRQERAVREIFGLAGDLPGLGQQQADLDRIGGAGDVRRSERRHGEAGGAQQGRTPVDQKSSATSHASSYYATFCLLRQMYWTVHFVNSRPCLRAAHAGGSS